MAGPFTSMFGPDALNLLGVIILTSLGTWALPQMVQKFYAIKTGPAIKQGAIISTIFALVVAGGSYFLGGFGRLFGGDIAYAANGTPIYDSIVPPDFPTFCLASWWCSCSPRPCRRLRVLCSPLLQRSHST